MALTKSITNDKFEVVSEYKHLQIREATVISEDGVELSRSFHRRILTPDVDISSESAEIQGIANAVWTDEVKAAWAAHQAAYQAAQSP
jgi:hypothetical protein